MMRRQTGFAYIAAVVFLVVIAGIAVALLRLTDTQQSTVNGAVSGARANLAARAGIEWAFKGLPNGCTEPPAPAAASTLNDFKDETGFRVHVTCTFRPFREGDDPLKPSSAQVKRIYRIEAVACNGTGDGCPGNTSVTRPDYVERARVATVCMLGATNNPCE